MLFSPVLGKAYGKLFEKILSCSEWYIIFVLSILLYRVVENKANAVSKYNGVEVERLEHILEIARS